MVGGEHHGDIDSRTGGAWYVNMKETSWGKETLWSNDEVNDAIRAKKEANMKWET